MSRTTMTKMSEPAGKKPAKKVPSKPVGRKTKFTLEKSDIILEALKSGCYLETAAQYAGVSKATLFNWLARGTKERDRLAVFPDSQPIETEVVFLEFVVEVEKVRAEAELRAIMQIQKAASDGTWQASAWYLERSYPKKWGRVDHTEITGEGGGTIKIDVSTEELERKIIAIASKNQDDD